MRFDKKSLGIVLIILPIFQIFGSELVLNGFYQGKDIYLRNPYITSSATFCIESVKINGSVVIESPRVAALRLDLSNFTVNQEVLIEVLHSDLCDPEVLNPQDLVFKQEFNFVEAKASANSIVWSTRFEEGGKFEIKRRDGLQWVTVKTRTAEGGQTVKRYEQPVDHSDDNNIYRIDYFNDQDEVYSSVQFEWIEKKDPITFSPESPKRNINFSREAFFEIFDTEGNQILKGTGESVNVKALRKGKYVLVLEGKKFEFYKR